MTGSLRQAWEYLVLEVWEPLAEQPKAPLDLFGDLFIEVEDFLSIATPRTVLEIIRNDPTEARKSFLGLKGTDFVGEFAILSYLEKAREVIADYDIAGYEELFKSLLREVIRKYNLRYRLDDPFTVRFLLPGSFTNLYAELHRVNLSSTHLASLLADFEHSFDRYAKSEDPTDLKTCIAKASNYAEGLASAAVGGSSGGTLGRLARQYNDWPHDKLCDALVSLYGFCSDYPGIRHAGSPDAVRRGLAMRDVTLASLLLLAFAAYISPAIDERTVLGL